MKHVRRIFASTLVLVAAVALTAPLANAQSQAAPLSDEQRAQIVTNCTSIQASLTQLKISDALLRANRGKTYESLRSRLMDTFNGRLATNSLDAKGMISVTQSYNASLNSFRDAYVAYERQLAAAIRIDCTKEPDEFHAATQDAREKRALVYKQILALHQHIDDYGSVVADFYVDFKRVSGAN
jgi:hypothetical protein